MTLKSKGILSWHRAVLLIPRWLTKDSVIVLAESGGRAHNSLPPSPRLLPHDINFIYRLLDRRRLKEGKKGEGFYLLCQAATCF